jgi:hypothetical protein
LLVASLIAGAQFNEAAAQVKEYRYDPTVLNKITKDGLRDLKTFSRVNPAFKMQYPAAWQTNLYQNAPFIFSAKPPNIPYVRVIVMSLDSGPKGTLDQVSNSILQDTRKQMFVKIVSKQVTTVGGSKAYKYELLTRPAKSLYNVTQVTVITMKGSQSYVVSFMMPEGTLSDLRPLWDKMVASIEL